MSTPIIVFSWLISKLIKIVQLITQNCQNAFAESAWHAAAATEDCNAIYGLNILSISINPDPNLHYLYCVNTRSTIRGGLMVYNGCRMAELQAFHICAEPTPPNTWN